MVPSGGCGAYGRDDDIGGLDLVAGEGLGVLAGDVQADLGHRGDNGGVELAGGLGSGRGDPDTPGGLVVQQRGGHLGAARVVRADEEHSWDVGHGWLPSSVSRPARPGAAGGGGR